MTELVPSFGHEGALELGIQFTAPTCYACTRGGWGSYSNPNRPRPRHAELARAVRPPPRGRTCLCRRAP